MTGEIAKALGARANELFAAPPQIEKIEVLASTPLKQVQSVGDNSITIQRDDIAAEISKLTGGRGADLKRRYRRRSHN